MMDDSNPLAPPVTMSDAHGEPDGKTSEPAATEPNTAVMKFKSCRWRCDPESGEFCTHRDVLPFAGKEGFVPESWCPDCAFYKLRRSPKKREYSGY